MSLKPLLEDLLQSASTPDAADLQSLVSLQELFSAVRSEVEADHASAAGTIEQANDVIEQIVMRELDDTQAAIQYIADTIDYLGNLVDSLCQGNNDCDTAPPTYGTPTAQLDDSTQSQESESPTTNETTQIPADIDPELVSAWASQCEHTLPELEAIIVSLDSNGDTADVLADVRRRVHTIKGECGILSLDDASLLCHEAESAIDRCLECKIAFPVDDLLNLIDWLKKYVQVYADDPNQHHPSPEHAALLQAFKNYALGDTSEPAPSLAASRRGLG